MKFGAGETTFIFRIWQWSIHVIYQKLKDKTKYFAKEVIAHYTSCSIPVRCVSLDSSKAFDKIHYGKLFKLLLDRDVPPHVIWVLLNMYTDQQIRVLWNGEYSKCFSVKNGVKQGAIVSPTLFCVYLDVLLTELKKAGLGCFIGTGFAAALAYADDIILMAPSARAMRGMLAICDKFAKEYRVTFKNSLKQDVLSLRHCRLLQSAITRQRMSIVGLI